ncbi:MAG: flagellar assembly protein FliH [Thiovulaceae bacterium]|nr:flagellar assembly protein FliH [Sulfurimonadaceae bacterium]
MKTLITTDNLVNHTVDKYRFKVFSSHGSELEDSHDQSLEHENFQPLKFEPEQETPVEIGNRDELVESLLKKTDEMTSNFIKLQMKLEVQEEEYKEKVEIEKKASYEKGLQDATELTNSKFESDKVTAIAQFAESIKALENSANEYKSALESIKKELLEAALDIAKEVIEVELSSNSSKVAYTLAHELIKDLQSASKIKLKVNPNDHGWLSEKIGSLGNIEIISDRAVSPGGVVAISDAGNIDAQILNRYERVKQAALQED